MELQENEDKDRVFEELKHVLQLREEIKQEFQSVASRLDSLTIPKTYYDRIGVLSNGSARWNLK